jgi:hypothetical protein
MRTRFSLLVPIILLTASFITAGYVFLGLENNPLIPILIIMVAVIGAALASPGARKGDADRE